MPNARRRQARHPHHIANILDEARHNYRFQKFDAAEQLCLEIFELEPSNLNNLLLLGAIYISRRDFQNALKYNELAILCSSRCAEAYGNMGNVYKEIGDIEKAVQLYRTAVQVNANFLDAWTNMALAYVQKSDLDNAVICYKKALSINPNMTGVRSDMGNLLKSQGKLEEAKESYLEALRIEPNFPTAWSNLGCVHSDDHNLAAAIECFEKAVSLDKNFVDAWVNLGNVAKDAKLLDKALMAYKTVLRLKPDHCLALSNCACVYLEKGNQEMAALLFNKAIKLHSHSPDVYSNLGNALRELGRTDEAIEKYRKALELNPYHADSLNNLGNAYKDTGNVTAALDCYEKALEVFPNFPAAHSNLASVLKDMHKYDEALEHYALAIELDPNFADAFSNMGNALKDTNKIDEAIVCYKKAIALNPVFADAFSNLASAYKDKGLFVEAIEYYIKALHLKPNFPDAVCNLAHCYRLVCNWKGWDDMMNQVKTVVSEQLREGRTPSVQPHHLMLYPFSSEVVKQVASKHGLACIENAAGMKMTPFQFEDNRKMGRQLTPGDRLRVGYVSSDFGNHPTAHLMQSVPGFHNRERIECFCYALSGDDSSGYRKKMQNESEHFVDVSGMSTSDAAMRIHNDKIHILINLNGYTKGARNEIFALRPAPIQVMWLGYPGTSGIGFMDYMIVDNYLCNETLIPWYSEKLVYMPNSYFVGDHRQSFSHMLEDDYYKQSNTVKREQYGLGKDKIVFCNFNQLYKIDSGTFDVWMAILKAVPNSVLWLLQFPAIGEPNIRKSALDSGVAEERIIFSPVAPKEEHIQRGGLADVFLDTPLCNAHTTGTDILWSGIPMITLPREPFASRVASSLLHAMNCPELVVQSLKEYQELAIKLGSNIEYLNELKKKVRDARQTSPLFDTKQTTKDLERSYFSMWQRRQNNLEPDHIPTSDLIELP